LVMFKTTQKHINTPCQEDLTNLRSNERCFVLWRRHCAGWIYQRAMRSSTRRLRAADIRN